MGRDAQCLEKLLSYSTFPSLDSYPEDDIALTSAFAEPIFSDSRILTFSSLARPDSGIIYEYWPEGRRGGSWTALGYL